MILVEHYVNFLIEHDLTQEQLLFLELVYHKKVDLINRYKKHFPVDDYDGMISPYLLNKLEEKEFIIKTTTGYKLGDKYKDIYVTPDIAVDELFDLYPSFMLTNEGVNIPLTTMDKRVFREIYLPKIMGNLQEHKEVLKDIQYGIDNNLLNLGINKFLTSQYWLVLRKERISNLGVDSVTVYDSDF